MYHINTGVKPFSSMQDDSVYTEEGFTSFFAWLKEMPSTLKSAYVTVFQTKTVAVITQAKYDSSVFEYVRTASPAVLGRRKVHRPSRLDEPMLPWVQHMIKQVTALSDIETRLYDPVIKYLAAVITDEANGDKIWNPRELKITPLAEVKAAMGKFLSNRNDAEEYIEFEEVYPRQSHFRESYDGILELQSILGKIDIDGMLKKEERIVELVIKLLDANGPNLDEVLSKQNKAKLAESLKSVAEEAEIFAVTIYEINKIIAAHNSNVVLIRTSM